MADPVGTRQRNVVARGNTARTHSLGSEVEVRSSTSQPEVSVVGGHVPGTPSTHRPPIGGNGATGGTGALSGRGAPQVTTSRLNLRDVVEDPAFVAQDPALLLRDNPKAKAIADLIDKSDTILLVGHISPDGDCVGSTLSLARALKALGKKVDVVVDDQLSVSLQQIDEGHEVKRARDVAGKSWDAAIVMDVAEAARIGGAAALLQHARAAAVVDHHVATPTAQMLGLKPGTPFHAWVEPDYPAASLQSAAFLSRYTDRLRERGVDLKRVFMPALAGFATDTGFGNHPGASKEHFPFFKHMLLESARSSMAELESTMSVPMPQRLLDEVHGRGWDASNGATNGATNGAQAPNAMPDDLRAALDRAHRTHRAIETRVHHGPRGKLGVLTVHSEYFGALLRLARLDDPRLTALDVANLIKWDCVKDLNRREHCDMTALLSEQRDGTVKVSTRSRPPRGQQGGQGERARLLAEALGGGGHGHAAGASVNKPLAVVNDAVLSWARAQGFAR